MGGNKIECSLEIYVGDSDRTVPENGKSPVISRFDQVSYGGVFPEETVLSFIYEVMFVQIVNKIILQQVHVRAMGR